MGHDEGQMGIEEDFTRKVSGQDQTDVIRHGLGARGIDFIKTDAYNASPSGAYPLYDGHGNMIATLTKQPTNSISLSARRYTDPWGVTRVGASTGKPDQRYCANLGHRQDDESGLTYMRARYFEPTTGRFVGEDPARDGVNWFSYCAGNPTNYVDPTGKAKRLDIREFEDLVRRLLADGRITQEYFNRFTDKSAGIRRAVHDAITRQGLTLEEIADFIESDCRLRGSRGFHVIGIGLSTLDAAFNQDPFFIIELIRDIFGGGS